MILCLDAGNTRLKWGLHDGGLHDGVGWLEQAALEYQEMEQLPARLPAPPTRAIACNVAGAAATAAIERLAARLAVPLSWFASSATACGVSNGYAKPMQLGADRWAALIGAHALHAGAAIVVLAGTATTIDQLDAAGHFRGGLILPGLRLMRASLARDTAQLPFAHGSYREAPDNTNDAIVSGSLHATLGAIERMRTVLGAGTIVLSGGAAAELAPFLDPPVRQVEHLVLEGLLKCAAQESLPAPPL